MTLLIGTITMGLIASLLAMGVYTSFRIFGTADITADGSITLGAAVTALLLAKYGVNPMVATAAGMAAGAIAGMVTGVLHTHFGINSLLAGILTMTGLYSINLKVMGKSNLPLMDSSSLSSWADAIGLWMFGAVDVNVFGWSVGSRELTTMGGVFVIVVLVALALYFFFHTDIGTAMRATGDNGQMVIALGGDTRFYFVAGLALSNSLIALSGALLAQYQGFADAQMGIGMIVSGLASVIIGEALTGARSLGFSLIGAIMGAIFFRLLVSIALRWGLDPNMLRLVTAVFVFIALVSPLLIRKLVGTRRSAVPAPAR